MKAKVFTFNLFDENTVVIYDLESREAAIVDPGMTDEHEVLQLTSFVSDNSLTVKYLINTHIHIDHVVGNTVVEEKYDVGLSASPLDEPLAARVSSQRDMFRLKWDVPESIAIAHPLKAGDRLMLGHEEIEVLDVPGHSPGSIALYCPGGNFVVTGDAVFRGSIGRTDLPGGDYATLIRSITDNILTLPDDTVIIPGHGPATTVAFEKSGNPFL